MFNKNNLPSLLLRIGLALVFLYASISSFITPNDWIGYLPQFARDYISADILLKVFAVYEFVLALWLISGKYTKYAALFSAVTLLGITLLNLSLFAITFRDVGLVFAAIALYFCKE